MTFWLLIVSLSLSLVKCINVIFRPHPFCLKSFLKFKTALARPFEGVPQWGKNSIFVHLIILLNKSQYWKLPKTCFFGDSESRVTLKSAHVRTRLFFYLNQITVFKLCPKYGCCSQLHSIKCTFFKALPHCVFQRFCKAQLGKFIDSYWIFLSISVQERERERDWRGREVGKCWKL